MVEQLLAHEVNLAFCVPGESYLPVLDGLYQARDRLRLITARQEGGAAMMAAAHGKLTGRPGVCFVTRGPGATNASGGVHAARQDASPMVLFVGQVPTTLRGRRAFQEVDHQAMFAPLAKAVHVVDHPDRLPEIVSRAMRTAVSGEPGPVVVELPEDVLSAPTAAAVVPPAPPVVPSPSEAEVQTFLRALTSADRPLLVVGGSGWTPVAAAGIQRFAEAGSFPVATAVRHQDLVDNNSPAYVGTLGLNTTPGLTDAVRDADLIAMVGTRPDALTVDDFALLAVPAPTQRLLHVHPDPNVLQQVYRAELAITSGPAPFTEALPATALTKPTAWQTTLRTNYEQAPTLPEAVPYLDVLNARLSQDAIISTGAGAYTAWPQRHRRFTSYPSQLGTQSGTMGYGLPAAITAQLVHPDRQAVAFAGDGCFLMTGQELSTAVRYDLHPLIIVVNNNSYGTIRNHQRQRFPDREYGTSLVNPNFASYARSFNANGEQVSDPEEFAEAVDRALTSRTASLIEITTT